MSFTITEEEKQWSRGLGVVEDTPLTPAKGEPMPQTCEYWQARALRGQELILEMKAENSKLRSRINILEQLNRAMCMAIK